MSHNEEKDDHANDMVMPGFRFHPTEEELIEFYLRRKVEGKRFNVELITFLDLYRYDPWELPALAAIGEKEWFFYVPRDRKYRNGDRPNRVTTSGYWKATGADRMIRTESGKSIGLKKTLVFYSGKAPKGIRTSWIMNEYRLPQHETDRYQKAEISLCRVYKRPGVLEDSSISSGPSSSRGKLPQADHKKQGTLAHNSPTNIQYSPSPLELEKEHETEGGSSSTSTDKWVPIRLSNDQSYSPITHPTTSLPPPPPPVLTEEHETLLRHPKQVESSLVSPNFTTLFTCSPSLPIPSVDDLHRIIHYQQAYTHQQLQQTQQQQQQPQEDSQNFAHQNPTHFLQLPPDQQQQLLALNTVRNSSPRQTFQDKLWEWNLIPEANKDYNNNDDHFK